MRNSTRLLFVMSCLAAAGVTSNAIAAKGEKAEAPAPETAEAKAGKSGKPAKAPKPADGPESSLKQGMSAKEVRKLMGRDPDEIRPMEAPSGKAEVWVYNRPVSQRREQVQTGSRPIVVTTIDAEGRARSQQVGEEVDYKTQRFITEDVVSLLMFNDHYLQHGVKRSTRREIE